MYFKPVVSRGLSLTIIILVWHSYIEDTCPWLIVTLKTPVYSVALRYEVQGGLALGLSTTVTKFRRRRVVHEQMREESVSTTPLSGNIVRDKHHCTRSNTINSAMYPRSLLSLGTWVQNLAICFCFQSLARKARCMINQHLVKIGEEFES